MLFPFFKWIYGLAGKEDPAEWSWRTCCVIPGLMCTIFTYAVLKYADDSPKGNYQKRKHLGLMQTPSAMQHIKAAIHDHNTWLLLIQYGCCFGVELTTSNAAALYFKEEFELSTEAAAAVASTFGWMNLFARGLGGFMSDISNAYKGMRGRLFWQLSCFLLEGAFVMVFSKATTLAGAIIALMAFSIFVQGAEGSTFGIVPYLNPNVTGTVAGIVGAGGNAGAVIFSILFRQLEYRQAFFVMGATTSVISLLSSFVWIKGYEGLFFNTRITPVDPPHEERLNNSNIQQLQQHAPNTPELQQVNEEKDDELQGNQSRSYIDTDPQSSISGPLSH
jgi:NNP family nitrate/nitrite transporter-like MFS transporter